MSGLSGGTVKFLGGQGGCWASRTGDKTQSELHEHNVFLFLLFFRLGSCKRSSSVTVHLRLSSSKLGKNMEEAQESGQITVL